MNPKYLVLEMQTSADGTVGNLVSAYDGRNEAESQYHLVLSSAAISQLPIHAAILAMTDGTVLASKHYVHSMPSPEPEE